MMSARGKARRMWQIELATSTDSQPRPFKSEASDVKFVTVSIARLSTTMLPNLTPLASASSTALEQPDDKISKVGDEHFFNQYRAILALSSSRPTAPPNIKIVWGLRGERSTNL
jgi:hypothetical protein